MIQQISDITCCENVGSEKRLRECNKRRSCKTIFYRIVFSNQVAGHLALDRWPEPKISKLTIYELFIGSKHRHAGYGVKTISDVVALAKKEGYSYINLSPCEIDPKFPMQEILNFYKKMWLYKKPSTW